jgi:hypothetical protein
MFGGVIKQNMITNEFWAFDLDTHLWTKLIGHNDTALAYPAATAGHTAHLIGSEMHILFGYNPYEGYLYAPQIYSFGKWFWFYSVNIKIDETRVYDDDDKTKIIIMV